MRGCDGKEEKRWDLHRTPHSASPCEQVGCAFQIRLLQHFRSAIAAPNKSPRRMSMLTAFGSARTNGLPLKLCDPASRLSFLLRTSVRHTDACHSQGAQETDREHPQAGSCQTAKDDGGKPGMRFLARSKRGTRFRTASPLGGTRQRRRRFCSPWVGRDQGRRHCRWRSPDDRNWLSFHDRYQLRGQPHPHGLNMLGLNRFQRS